MMKKNTEEKQFVIFKGLQQLFWLTIFDICWLNAAYSHPVVELELFKIPFFQTG